METLKFLFDAIVWLVIGFYIGRTFGKKHNLDFARVIAILPDSVVKTLRKAGFKLRAGQFSNCLAAAGVWLTPLASERNV